MLRDAILENEFDIVGIEIISHDFYVVQCWFIPLQHILIKIESRPIVF